MKPISQQLSVKEFPFIVKNSNGKVIYYEDSNGSWYKKECDSNGGVIYFENSIGFWYKKEYDTNGNVIYYENSNGIIRDSRPKEIFEMTVEEICKELGKNVKIIK